MNNEIIIQSLANKLSKDPNFAFCELVFPSIYSMTFIDVFWYENYEGKWTNLNSWHGLPVYHCFGEWTREERKGEPKWEIS